MLRLNCLACKRFNLWEKPDAPAFDKYSKFLTMSVATLWVDEKLDHGFEIQNKGLPTTAPGAFFCLHHLLLSLVFFGCFESKLSCFSVWRCSWRPCARSALAPARRVSGAPGATPSQRRNGTDATPAELQATAVEEPGQETAMEKLRGK